MSARRAGLPPHRTTGLRPTVWQTCLLAGGSSLFLRGMVGTVVRRLLG